MNKFIFRYGNAAILVCVALSAGPATARADDQGADKVNVTVSTQSETTDDALPPLPSHPDRQNIIIQSVEDDPGTKQAREVAWLGLGVEESSEALSSQLALKPGEGLTVNFLAGGSPAAQADFRLNDVLVELDGQMLVHPMQFRKLVQMHAEGDTIKLTFFRAGKKQTASVKLAKTKWDQASANEIAGPRADLEKLRAQLAGLNGQMRGMQETLDIARLDKASLSADVDRTMEQTRKAIKDAMRVATADRYKKDTDLYALARDGVNVDNDTTITFRNKRNSSKTMLQTDETGSYLIESGAKTRLIARDTTGKVLFEGEIDTPAQRQAVPKGVWEKVEPMFNQITAHDDAKPKADDSKVAK